MSGNNAPPAPDYSPITNALTAQGTNANNLVTQQMGWAQNQATGNQATTNQVVGQDLGVQGTQNDFAGDIQKQYENTYVPLENQFAQQAKDYASQGNIDQQMGRAESDTAQQMDQGRMNAQRDLESFGISPDSTRFQALDIGTQAQKGAAVAAAGNQARQNTVNTGLALEGQAIGQGEVMPSMAAGTINSGLQAGAGAVNSGLATTASGANTMGTAPQYMGLANGAYGLYGNTLNQSYQNQLGQFNANQNASSGLGSLLGAGLGAAGNVFKGAGTLATMGAPFGFEKGGAVPDVNDHDEDDGPFVPHHFYAIPGHDEAGHRMPIHESVSRFLKTGHHIGVFASPEHANDHIQRTSYGKYATGGAVDGTQGGGVPPDASPSRGAVTDDVPAKLNAGEFVMPKDTVAWYGQKTLQQMIEKGRKDRAMAPAHPQFKPASAVA